MNPTPLIHIEPPIDDLDIHKKAMDKTDARVIVWLDRIFLYACIAIGFIVATILGGALARVLWTLCLIGWNLF
jgi:hypothetical protein